MVDYHEGAGGEFIARFISAHFGHELEFDQQAKPNHLQKWLNSYSLITPDWAMNFAKYFQAFLDNCALQQITSIAVPYHLYKWPDHVDTITSYVPQTQFVKINSHSHRDKVDADFRRKVLDRPITDFKELQFLLSNRDKPFVNNTLKLYQNKNLYYRDIFPWKSTWSKTLPSNDIEILYSDFFCEFDRTANAYQQLCSQLNLVPDPVLLTALIQRNQKTQSGSKTTLSKA